MKIKPCLLLIFILWGMTVQAQKQLYRAKNARIDLVMDVRKIDIKGINESASSVLNPQTGQLSFSVPVQAFRFKRAIIQKLFNYPGLTYSKKFPFIKFKGQIANFEKLNLRKKRHYPIEIQGEITVRGVTKPLVATGELKGGRKAVLGVSRFTIHDISRFGIGKVNGKAELEMVKGVDVNVVVKAIYKK